MVKGFKKDGKFVPTGNKHVGVGKHQISGHQEIPSSIGNEMLQRKKESINQDEAKKQHEAKLDRQYDYFLQGMNDYGTGDIANAIDFADEVGIGGKELSDLVRDQAEQMETPLEDVDINYIIYDHVLQMARNEIDSIIGFDFLNDAEHNDTEFYTAGNYMATTYDSSQEAQDELQEKINGATESQKKQLKENLFVKQFLEYNDIDLD